MRARRNGWINVPNLVVARTFSKVYGLAGMRIGYAIGSKEVIAAMSEHLIQDNGSAAGLAAARAALQDQAHVNELPDENQRHAQVADERIAGAGLQDDGFAGEFRDG